MVLIISFSNQRTVPELPVEMVERKGKGHPESICDMAAEEVSIELSKYFLNNGPEIMSKFYGESEARLREVFKEAEQTHLQ